MSATACQTSSETVTGRDSRREYGPRVYDSIVELAASIDNPTPMVRVSSRTNPNEALDLLLKLEAFNPFGSIKDRAARFMLDGLDLEDGQVIAEPTAGNTGIALTALANARGLAVEIAVPDGTPKEKKTMLKFLGAELIEVEDEACPLFPTEGARGVVKSLVDSPALAGRYVSPNQYENTLNVEAHYRTTGPEIWRQTGGDIDYLFASVGTGGTIAGAGQYLKEQNPDIRIIAVEPAERQHRLSGIKRISDLPDEHFPKILNRALLDDIVAVSDDDAFGAGIRLARSEGVMVGPTSGAVLHAALEFGVPAGRAVLIACDSATKYLSDYADFLDR